MSADEYACDVVRGDRADWSVEVDAPLGIERRHARHPVVLEVALRISQLEGSREALVLYLNHSLD